MDDASGRDGGAASCSDPLADCPAPTTECLVATCTDGVCGIAAAAGTCASDGGSVCGAPGSAREGQCVGCNLDADCTAPALCDPMTGSQTCVAPTCADGVTNGTESDTDCGGDCPRCANERTCTSALDCQSDACREGTCVACADNAGCAMGHYCREGACLPEPDPCLVTVCAPGEESCQTEPLDCDDGNPCTVDRCSRDSGCTHPTWLADGNLCDDGIACTAQSFCTDGACGNGASNCDSGPRCERSVCDVSTGECTPGVPVVCPAPADPTCFARECSLGTGICTTTASDDRTCITDDCASDTECDDHDACTVDVCRPTDTLKVCDFTPRTCDDGDATTVDFCIDPVVGCQHRLRNISLFCDDGFTCTHDTWDSVSGACRHTPVHTECDDGDAGTVDTCELAVGCQNLACPLGTTSSLGACWVMTRFVDPTGGTPTPTDCDVACAGVGLVYAEATREVAGSDGTDASCRTVLAALGNDDKPLELPSASCATGLGCHVDVLFDEGRTPGHGRCATPPTDATSVRSYVLRACACQ